MDNDDPEKRIAELEGRSAPIRARGRRRQPWHSPWVWWVLILAILIGFRYSVPALLHTFPALNRPAPDWVGLLVLALPLAAGVVYGAMQISKARRRRRFWGTAADRRDRDGRSDCGGGGSGCSGSGSGGSGCGGGHGGCGGGSGCGGGGCGGGD